MIELGRKVTCTKDIPLIDNPKLPTRISVPKGTTGRIVKIAHHFDTKIFAVRFQNTKTIVFSDGNDDLNYRTLIKIER